MAGQTGAQVMTSIRACLMTAQKPIIFKVGDDIVLEVPDGNHFVDVKNGPYPIHCNILQLTEATFAVDFMVKTYVIECCGADNQPYLSNRWSETNDIDEDYYTKRTIKGQIIFRADEINSKKRDNAGNRGADWFRSQPDPFLIGALFKILPNFRRKSMNFVVDEAGVTLNYTIVDVEEYVMPPESVTHFTASHTVTSKFASSFIDSVEVKVWGDGITPKSTLYTRMCSILLAQLQIGTNTVIKGAAVKWEIDKNTFEARIDTLVNSGPPWGTTFGIPLPVKPGEFSKLDYLPLGKDAVAGFRNSADNPTPTPSLRGTANLAMLVFDKYLTLCVNKGPPTSTVSDLPPYFPEVDEDTEIETQQAPQLPVFTPTGYQTQLQSGIYTHYYSTIDYQMDGSGTPNGKVIQMPYMSTSASNCAIIPLCQNVIKKIVKFSAERAQNPPTVPSFLTTNPNNILLESKIKPANIDVAADGYTLTYKIEGEYVFAVANWQLENQSVGGTAPYIVYGVNDSGSGILVNGLIDTQFQGQGSPLSVI